MAISTKCPHCFTPQSYLELMMGKKARCKACLKQFIVASQSIPVYESEADAAEPEVASAPSARYGSALDSGESTPDRGPARPGSARRQQHDARTALLIITGGSLFVLTAAAATVYLLLNPPASAHGQKPGSSSTSTSGKETNTTQQAQTMLARVEPHEAPPPPATIRDNVPATMKKTEREQPKPPPEPEPMKIVPDPTKLQVQVPMTTAPGQLPPGSQLIYPSGTTAHVLVAYSQGKAPKFVVVNLESMAPKGEFLADPKATMLTLSRDGEKLAGRIAPTLIRVWSKSDSGTNPLDVKLESDLGGWLDFPSSSVLLTQRQPSKDKLSVDVWNLETGQLTQTFNWDYQLAGKSLTLSPGGSYLAFATSQLVVLTSLDNASLFTALALPKNMASSLPSVERLAFSQDGQELSALCVDEGKSRIITWDMSSFGIVKNYGFSQNYAKQLVRAAEYQGQPLEWVPERAGWLLYGQLYISRAQGTPVQTLAFPAILKAHPRKVLNGQQLAVVDVGSRVQTISSIQIKALKQP